MGNNEFNWDEAINLAHKTAVEHGFWDDIPNYEHLAMLVITELSEAIDADRYGRHADTEGYKVWRAFVNEYIIAHEDRIKRRKTAFNECIKDTVEGELADACIRLMDMIGSDGPARRDIRLPKGSQHAACLCRAHRHRHRVAH